ncbi:MAG: DsbA family protein [Alphaproteobacteria bacterium]
MSRSVLVVSVAIIAIAGAALFFNNKKEITVNEAQATEQKAENQQQAMAEKPAEKVAQTEPNMKVTKGSGGKSTSYMIKDAPLPSDIVMGKKEAPIVIVEYASLTCPHCAHFSAAVLPEIEKKYIETGKARYILRQFPLNEPALKGAMLLDCIGEQDKERYYVFARVLFDAQAKWAFDGDYMAGLETIATVGGLSRDQFKNCVTNTDREMKVLKAKKDAADEVGIPHTPYFFIDGEVFEGDRTVEAVSAFIESRLSMRGKAAE